LLAGAVCGSTITYTYTAIASGNFEGNAFNSNFVTITVLADSSAPTAPMLPVDIKVGGYSDTLNNQAPSLYSSTGGCSSSPEFPAVSSCVGFQDAHGSVIFIASNALAGYVYGENIGPIDDPTPFLTGSTIADNGTITFNSVSDGVFTATGGSSAPEPQTALLLTAGLTGLLLIRVRRAR
jgi:hypothetical protein